MINLSAFVLVLNKSVPANNLRELIALAKAKPGTLNCGSAGNGTPPHLGCEMFNKMAGVQTVHVPFRESNSSITALMGNHVQMTFAQATVVRGQIEAGEVKALAVTTPIRSPLFPDLPTVQEAGLPGFEVSGWGSLVAPAGTPKQAIDKLNAEITREVGDPKVQDGLKRMGLDSPPRYTPAEVGDFIKRDIARWNRIIDMAGVTRAK
jgi:tripartite-type tricarboxylate transporter receptor subunit TctC